MTVERLDRGEYRLVRRTPPPNEGLVDWLLACPEKRFFVTIESESTDVATRNRTDFEKAGVEIVNPFEV